jgi:hypothetical protein
MLFVTITKNLATEGSPFFGAPEGAPTKARMDAADFDDRSRVTASLLA